MYRAKHTSTGAQTFTIAFLQQLEPTVKISDAYLHYNIMNKCIYQSIDQNKIYQELFPGDSNSLEIFTQTLESHVYTTIKISYHFMPPIISYEKDKYN